MNEAERRHLRRKRKLLLGQIAKMTDFIRGSVVLMKRRCSRANCRRCAGGEGHPTWVMTASSGGKTRTVYLGEGRVGEAKRMVANYRAMQVWIEAIAQINLALLIGKPIPGKGAGNE